SSHIDRFISADDSESDVTFLIENLKNMIMKELLISCVAESSVFSLASSVTSFSAAPLSVSFSATPQSSTLVPMSGSPAPAIPVPATPDFAVSAFITNSPHFKKILCRLNELHLSTKDIHVFRNRNADVILFYICECEAYTPCLRFTSVSEIILIKDDNTAETIFSHSQASSITFSLFSAEKIVHTSGCK
ncbi:uncharacterized protein BDCG_09306, partial [Blastomyces dermatitidis ER-3]